MAKPVCAVVGVGPGNGSAIARKFARRGYALALLARHPERLSELRGELGDAEAYGCDATDAEQVAATFARIERELGPVNVLVHNAGGGHFQNFDDTTPASLEADWRVNVMGLLLTAQAAVPQMRRLGCGSVMVIGATAAWTGNAGFAPFAAAKSAQRSLAQSMARHLGPQGIHVAYVVIDAVVDLPRTRQAMADKPDDFFIQPAHIAEAVYFVSQQPKSAWTFELDLRPYAERW